MYCRVSETYNWYHSCLLYTSTDYGVDNFAVGFRKDDTALRDKINSILAEMKKDGTADKIVEKWLGSSADLDLSLIHI